MATTAALLLQNLTRLMSWLTIPENIGAGANG
jgi:hypothetical protein